MSEAAEEVRQLVGRYWIRFLELEPLFATQVGEDRFDDRLPDSSETGLAQREQLNRAALVDLARFERPRLDLESRTALDMLESLARRQLDFVAHRLDRFWAVSHMFGSYYFGPAHLLGQLAQLQRADTPDRLDRYLTRLSAVPDYLSAIVDVMDEAVNENQTAPAIVVERTVDMVKGLLQTSPEESPAMEPLRSAPARERGRAIEVIRERVLPAFGAYLDGLNRYRPAARDSIGLSALPAGEEIYAAEILGWTTLAMAAAELHELGREELALVQGERWQVAHGLGFDGPEAALAAHVAAGGDTPGSRRSVLDLARDQVQRSWDAAPEFFGRVPLENCKVRPVEEYLEKHVMDYYLSPTEDGSRPGIFYVNTAPRPLHSLATTTFHETNPGHHFQAMIDLESPERAPIRRHGNELQGLAFSEGWGLYSERLADEMGLFRDDYERLGMLELQALRAARLVVDTGIHALGWSRDQARALLEETGLPDWKAAAEVDRYIAMPGQALSYKLGQLEIGRLRQERVRADEGRESLRGFHDRLLSLGALPLLTVRREMGGDA